MIKVNKKSRIKIIIKDADEIKLFSLSVPYPDLFRATLALIVSLLLISLGLLFGMDAPFENESSPKASEDRNKNNLLTTIIFSETLIRDQSRISQSLRRNSENARRNETIQETIMHVKEKSELTPYGFMKRRFVIYDTGNSDIEEFINFYNDVLRNIPHRWPLRKDKLKISSEYGWRQEPFFFMKKKQFHKGMDIKAQTGEGVYPAADGVVKMISNGSSGYGRLIVIEHSLGYETYYAHLNKIFVSKNQIINADSLIGESGNTGLSTGPHLHYEIRQKGKSINPGDFISY